MSRDDPAHAPAAAKALHKPTRHWLHDWPLIFVGAATLALQSLPGLGTLDYHSTLALSPIVGLAAAHLGLQERANLARTWRVAAVTLGPLLLYALSALWRPWCDLRAGLGFYLLGPISSAFVGLSVGFVSRRLGGRWAGWWIYALFAVISVRPAWHFLTSAQVSAWHELLGGIAGPLYEDGVRVSWAWISFRLLDLALWAPAVAWLLARPGARSRRLSAILFTTAVILCTLRAGPDGWHVGEDELRGALPLRVTLIRAQVGERLHPERAALILHLPAGNALENARRSVIQDAAVRWIQLRDFFGEAPKQAVHIFVYPDAQTRQRLMGAGRVDMAKPWLWQVHISMPGYGASVLKHELAHVFAATFAPPPLGLPLRGGWMPDALLIEGMATAAEWPLRDGLDPHQQARAMRRLGLAPELQDLLSTGGFLLESGARAYTLAGSFVRWVRQTWGRETMNALYLTADPAAATGQPLSALITAWEQFVDSEAAGPLNESDLARARARFERPGLLFRPCVLSCGRTRDLAQATRRAGNFKRARDLWLKLLARLKPHLKGQAPPLDIIVAAASARCRAGDCAEAVTTLNNTLGNKALNKTLSNKALVENPRSVEERSKLSKLQRAWLLATRGDLCLQRGQIEPARRSWHAALSLPIGESLTRRLLVQIALSRHAAGRRFTSKILAAGGPLGKIKEELHLLKTAQPTDLFVQYLNARYRLLRYGEDSAAATLNILARQLTAAPALRRACLRLAALHAARRGRCDEVRDLSGRLARRETTYSRRLRDRCQIARTLQTRGLR